MSAICDAQDEAAFLERYQPKHNFNVHDFASACDACYRGEDDETEYFITETKFIHENLAVMGVFDWVALVVTGLIVSATLADEINGIFITRFLVDRLSVKGAQPNRPLWWHMHSVIRLHSLMPIFIATIPTITALAGGGALKVCLNAVAIVFLADMDEFLVGFVPEELLEEAKGGPREAFGELSTAQEELLGIFKGFNMSTITFTILCVTLLGVVLKPYMILFGGTYTGWFIPAILQFIAIWHTGREDRDEMEYNIKAGDASHRKGDN